MKAPSRNRCNFSSSSDSFNLHKNVATSGFWNCGLGTKGNVLLQKSFPCHIPWASEPRKCYKTESVKTHVFRQMAGAAAGAPWAGSAQSSQLTPEQGRCVGLWEVRVRCVCSGLTGGGVACSAGTRRDVVRAVGPAAPLPWNQQAEWKQNVVALRGGEDEIYHKIIRK